MRWLHATLYINVASCETQRHDVLVGCRPKNVVDGLRGRSLGSDVVVSPQRTSVVLRPLRSSMFIKRNTYCKKC